MASLELAGHPSTSIFASDDGARAVPFRRTILLDSFYRKQRSLARLGENCDATGRKPSTGTASFARAKRAPASLSIRFALVLIDERILDTSRRRKLRGLDAKVAKLGDVQKERIESCRPRPLDMS